MSVKLDRDSVRLELVCNEPDNGWCHIGCEQCVEGCDDEAHRKPLGYCNPKVWMDNCEITEESYVGDNTIPLHDGMAVALEWTGDDWGWRPADD